MPKARSKKAKPADDVPASERIDAYIARHDDWRGERLAELRKIFHQADKAIVEEWKWMGSPVYSHDGDIAVTNAHKDKVKVTFAHGAQLEDPKKVFNNGFGGNAYRAIDLHEGDEIDAAGLKGLIREAIAYNASRKKKK